MAELKKEDQSEIKEWFYLDKDNKQIGPVTMTYLIKTFDENTLVWKEGNQWVPLASIEKNEKTDGICTA